MAEERKPATFWRYVGVVLCHTFTPFAWTRDLAIATVITLLTLGIQAYKKMIPDWQEHRWLWIASYVLPYFAVGTIHLAWRFAQAPWKVHQELETAQWKVQDEITSKLYASDSENALLRGKISEQTWPEKRPRLTFDRWGNREKGGYAQQEQGFYLTNHGETALEVVLEDFALGADKWFGDTLASIEGKQKGFIVVERKTFVYGQSQRWNLLDGFQVAKERELTVGVRYRDFDNNWYRSFALLKCAANFGSIDVGPTTQERLGSS